MAEKEKALQIKQEEQKSAFELFQNTQEANVPIPVGFKKGKWSPKEDELLKKYVEVYNYKNWKCISQKIPGRSPIQCLHRWTKILQPGLVKGPWTPQEDAKLIEWVRLQGPTKWTLCSETIKGRSGKQCREHWNNSLNPQVKKGEWTAKEDLYIMHFYKKFNGSWKKISPFFYKRTENSIKNRFFSQLRKIASQHIFSNEKKYSSKIRLEALVTFLDEATSIFKEKFRVEMKMKSIAEVDEYLKNIENEMEEKLKDSDKSKEVIENLQIDNPNKFSAFKYKPNEQEFYENYDIKKLEEEIYERSSNDFLLGLNSEETLENRIDNVLNRDFGNKVDISKNKSFRLNCKGGENSFDSSLFFIKNESPNFIFNKQDHSRNNFMTFNTQNGIYEYNCLVNRLLDLEKKVQKTQVELKKFKDSH